MEEKDFLELINSDSGVYSLTHSQLQTLLDAIWGRTDLPYNQVKPTFDRIVNHIKYPKFTK
jgi:hypothetical protein